MARTLLLALLCAAFVPIPASAQGSTAYAQELLSRHEYQQAADVLEDMAVRSSPRADVFQLLANAYIGLKQPDKAIAALEKGLRSIRGNQLESYYVALLRRTVPRK